MYSVVISLRCGISLYVLIALLQMSLFNSNTCLLMFFLEHAGVRFRRYSIWWADNIECMLPRAFRTSITTFSHLYVCICDASVCAKCPKDISGATKGQTQCYQKEKGSFILDAAAWTQTYISVKRRKRSLSPSLRLVFPSFLLLSLLLTVFDCIRQVNEKQHRRNDWQPFRAACTCQSVCLCVHTCPWLCLAVSCPQACQSTRWWDSKRVMRSSSIPSGWGRFCRREMVMKYCSHTRRSKKAGR